MPNAHENLQSYFEKTKDSPEMKDISVIICSRTSKPKGTAYSVTLSGNLEQHEIVYCIEGLKTTLLK